MLSYFNLAYMDAENGKIAVEILERSQNTTGDKSAPHFGFVLMDLCMPVMNGYEAIGNIRNKLNLDVPIVALTASAMEDEKRKALDAGATEFATKPLLPYLIATIMFTIGVMLPRQEVAEAGKRWPAILGGALVQSTV